MHAGNSPDLVPPPGIPSVQSEKVENGDARPVLVLLLRHPSLLTPDRFASEKRLAGKASLLRYDLAAM
jgi:hypothetical protein